MVKQTTTTTSEEKMEDKEEYMETEEEFRKRMEPVAPWNRDNIPDYGPLHDRDHLLIFACIGTVASVVYHYTPYFEDIGPWLAYPTIWFPLWFRLLSQISNRTLSEEEMEQANIAREEAEFQKTLQKIAEDEDID